MNDAERVRQAIELQKSRLIEQWTPQVDHDLSALADAIEAACARGECAVYFKFRKVSPEDWRGYRLALQQALGPGFEVTFRARVALLSATMVSPIISWGRAL